MLHSATKKPKLVPMEVQRVQTLATNGLSVLPEKFVRPPHERPENSKALKGITVPTISLSLPHHLLISEVSRASKEWGFFMVVDHGLSPELINRLQDVGKRFFELPQEEKESYSNDIASGSMEGYGTKMVSNLEQKVEWIDYYFHLIWPTSKVDYTKWPTNPPSYREVNENYGKELRKVADRLMEVLSEGLGLEAKALKASLGGEDMELEMKINMYPPCPQPELALGVEPHTDMSALTILVPNEVPGLQVWKDGNWVAVDYSPNTLFVHIGDQIEILSNGRYKSVLHRSLVNKERMRMSWALFFVPPKDALIGPLPQLVNDNNPSLFPTKTYEAFRYCKINKAPQ
ncbi:flavonol synthase/flavanone 3-hydroxylase-like [Tasmannia lanceolata]|uniref:flavonol synthase/flavanone 3-hydroxylase-like n=1 Tax=Tasmannia lanceolata TaxID=3420 RepID=UPI0040644AF4